MRIITSVTLAICVLSACSPPTRTISANFDPAEIVGCDGIGNGIITGQGFLRTMIGEVRYAAGEMVYLMPATAYTRELMSSDVVPTNLDKRLKQYIRQTQAGGEGEFEFTDLPPAPISWPPRFMPATPMARSTAGSNGGASRL